MPKRGRNKPKAKGPHHHLNSNSCFVKIINWFSYYVQKGKKVVFQKLSKPSWTLRGGSHLVGVLFSQRKSILKQGVKISKFENALQTLTHVSLTICKRTLKRIYKRICKKKTCGASMVRNIKNWRDNPCIYYKYLYWHNSKQPLHLHYAS